MSVSRPTRRRPVLRWAKLGATASLTGIYETATGEVRDITSADIARFVANFKHAEGEETAFEVGHVIEVGAPRPLEGRYGWVGMAERKRAQ